MVRSTAARAWSTLVVDPAFAPFDLILLDPPRPSGRRTLAGVDRLLAPADGCLEHARRTLLPDHAGRLDRGRDLRSGDSALAIYTCPH
jgi:hypothetical protein